MLPLDRSLLCRIFLVSPKTQTEGPPRPAPTWLSSCYQVQRVDQMAPRARGDAMVLKNDNWVREPVAPYDLCFGPVNEHSNFFGQSWYFPLPD